MVFNSIPFLMFFILFFAFWHWFKKHKQIKWIWIIFMSFIFYGWWDWRFLLLLIATGTIDYLCGYFIVNKSAFKKFALFFSVSSNIISLLIFKYSLFFAQIFDHVFNLFGVTIHLSSNIPQWSLALPLGISFYTFNSISYTIDLYKGKSKPAENILHFFAFISFFPHLVAGPIIRAKDILGQLKNNRLVNHIEIYNGIKTILWGFFQKMVLADNLAVIVNSQFSGNAVNDSVNWWLCMLSFTGQIYFDFNGYSTIARGIAKLSGIHFRLNFNHPYFSTSFRQFWQRWHISLSSFFRDYVYIPLGGSKMGKYKAEFNRWITMLLSGLWHGANFTFIIWGALHAMFLTVERYSFFKIKNKTLNHLLVFILVVFTWVFFRADNLNQAMMVVKQMLSFNSETTLKKIFLSNAFFWLFAAIAIEFIKYNQFLKKIPMWMEIVIWGHIAISIILFRGPEQSFIYFQF